MRQRRGIARALMAEPASLRMGKPFGSLDTQTWSGLQAAHLATWEREQRSVVFVTHDIREAIHGPDRKLGDGPNDALAELPDRSRSVSVRWVGHLGPRDPRQLS